MKSGEKNSFEEEPKYKLYRTVYEIIHPTISKKNISNYRIVLQEGLLPVRVFYPKKVSNLTSIILFIHGDPSVTGCGTKYADICMKLAMDLEQLVIAIDYDDILDSSLLDLYQQCYQVIEYFYQEVAKLGVDTDKITLMGDSTGASIAIGVEMMAKEKGTFSIRRKILFYPPLSGEYFGKTHYDSIQKNSEFDLLTILRLQNYFNLRITKKKQWKNPLFFPLLEKDPDISCASLFVVGNMDPLRDEINAYYQCGKEKNNSFQFLELEFVGHGFLKMVDIELQVSLFDTMKKFLK